MMNRTAALVVIALVLVVASVSGCASIYSEKSAAAIADGVKGYCVYSTPIGRSVIRQELAAELAAEGVEICLGCPGEPTTICSGGPHRPKVDDT